MSSHTAEKGASRKLGVVTATLFTAAMIVGTGLFTSLGAATAQAGSGIIVAVMIGGLVALATGISAAQAGTNDPEEGGAFIWNRRAGHIAISFVAGCAYLIEGLVGLGILALGFATYSAQMFPWLPIQLTASLALVGVATVNFLGISPTAKVLIAILGVNLALLGIYVAVAAPHVDMRHLSPVFGTNLRGTLSGAAVFFWTWDGFQRTAIMANEIGKPRTTIPIAIVGGISIAAAVYLIITSTTLGLLGAEAMASTDAPVFRGATTVFAAGGWLILASAWMTSFSEMLGDLLATSHVGHSMGAEHELPRWLAAIHARFKSPHRALGLLTIVGVALVCLVPLRNLMPVASACTLVWYTATHLAALQVPKERRLAPVAISWIGIAACAGLAFSLPVWSLATSAGILIALAGLRWFIRVRNRKAQRK